MRPGKNAFEEYAVPDVVYIDVDGTLIINDRVNKSLVRWSRKQAAAGKQIIVWSARGEENSKRAVEMCGISDIVSHALSKPGYVVDDLGNGWTQYMNIMHVNDIDRSNRQGKRPKVTVSMM